MIYIICIGLMYLLSLFVNLGITLAYLRAQRGSPYYSKRWKLTNSDVLIYAILASVPGFFGTYGILKTCGFPKYGWQVPFTAMETEDCTEDQSSASIGTCKSIWKE